MTRQDPQNGLLRPSDAVAGPDAPVDPRRTVNGVRVWWRCRRCTRLIPCPDEHYKLDGHTSYDRVLGLP